MIQKRNAIKISNWRGLAVSQSGAPLQEIRPANTVQTVGMLGADYPGVRAELLVSSGDQVIAGMPLFCDRKRKDILFTSPVAGRLTDITIGAKRRFSSLTIEIEGNQRTQFAIPEKPDRDQAQRLLLESGLWPGFLARPFGRIPNPGSAPDAIFITAMDTRPQAALASVVLAGRAETFERAVAFLTALTDGPVFVCQAPGPRLVDEGAQVRCATFDGAHPAGLAGTHVNRLFPVRGKRQVWQINYQDVLALGHLLETGELVSERIISLAGPCVRQPRLIRVPAGVNLTGLTDGELSDGAKCVLSGSALDGRESRYLGRYHWQISVWPRRPAVQARNWLRSAKARAQPGPVIPTEALEHALGPRIPVMPLVRALSVGDAETAERLGCRELLEEDMALITHRTGGRQDFSAMLRLVLNSLEVSA